MLATTTLLWTAALCLARVAWAEPYPAYDYGFDIDRLVKRDMSGFRAVKSRTQDELPVRQEIRQLEKNEEQWTLYLLAMSVMQFTDQTASYSWYGITGIHAIPYTVWAGVEPISGNEQLGYCSHVSNLFLTWHRPYLVLYEQVMLDLVQRIASLWPEGEDRQRYQEAASTFRIPYWDWAIAPPTGESVLPFSVGGSPYVDVKGPYGSQRIANPLFSYGFKPLNSSAFIQHPFDFWNATLRAPTSWQDPNASSNNSKVARELDIGRVAIQQRLFNLFTNYPDYNTFSNEATYYGAANYTSYDSLESLHDTVHTMAGGDNGHMAYIPYSAFDPIFFIHHTMVDRVFAMWQVLYPDSWMGPQDALMGTATIAKGQTQNAKTALSPFLTDNNSNWDSDMVRDHRIFGYTYEEVVGDPKSGDTKARVKQAVNTLYGTSSPSRFARTRQVEDAMDNEALVRGRLSRVARQRARSVLVGNQYREWIANIRVYKQALDGPFTIYIFLGDAPARPEVWPVASNLVGSLPIFAADAKHGAHMTNLSVSGTVPLTASLVDTVTRGLLSDLNAETTEPFLLKRLQYRIRTGRGRAVDPSEVPSLDIQIVSSMVNAPNRDDELPTWGPTSFHFTMA